LSMGVEGQDLIHQEGIAMMAVLQFNVQRRHAKSRKTSCRMPSAQPRKLSFSFRSRFVTR
jgi:hypothetical protein